MGRVFIPSRWTAEKRGYKYDGGREARGKSQAYWAGKIQRFAQRNDNSETVAPLDQYLFREKECPTKKRPNQHIRREIAEAAMVF